MHTRRARRVSRAGWDLVLGVLWIPGILGPADVVRAAPGLQAQPDLAAGERSLFLVHIDDHEAPVHRVRVRRFGDPLRPDAVFELGEPGRAGTRPRIATGPGGGVVVWESWGPGGSRIAAVELGPDGGPRSPVTRFGDAGARRPAVAVDGDLARIVWEEGGDESRIVGARWLRGRGLLPGPDAVSSGAGWRPAIAAGHGGFLVAWTEEGPGFRRVRTRRMPGPGAAPEPERVLASGEGAAVGADDRGFVIVWRAGTGTLGVATLDPAAVPTSVAGLAGGDGLRFGPRIAAGDGGFAVVWVHAEAGAGRRTVRAVWWSREEGLPATGTALTGLPEWAAEPSVAILDGSVFVFWRSPRPEDEDDLRGVQFPSGRPPRHPVPVPWPVRSGSSPGIEPPPPARGLRALPNPSRTSMRIVGGSRTSAPLELFDLRGRRVRELPGHEPGRWIWDGRDAEGRRVSPGVYFGRSGKGSLRLVRLP